MMGRILENQLIDSACKKGWSIMKHWFIKEGYQQSLKLCSWSGPYILFFACYANPPKTAFLCKGPKDFVCTDKYVGFGPNTSLHAISRTCWLMMIPADIFLGCVKRTNQFFVEHAQMVRSALKPILEWIVASGDPESKRPFWASKGHIVWEWRTILLGEHLWIAMKTTISVW